MKDRSTPFSCQTYPDKLYPGSQNSRFLQLVDVYLDGVSSAIPRPSAARGGMTRVDDGWVIKLKAVFNEMTGAIEPATVLGDQIQRSLYPDTPTTDSGGGRPYPQSYLHQFKHFIKPTTTRR